MIPLAQNFRIHSFGGLPTLLYSILATEDSENLPSILTASKPARSTFVYLLRTIIFDEDESNSSGIRSSETKNQRQSYTKLYKTVDSF